MLTQQPVKQCFMVLCFGAAAFALSGHWWGLTPSRGEPVLFPTAPQQLEAMATLASYTSSTPADTRRELTVHLNARVLKVFYDGDLEASYPIAVGQAEWQTPEGKFQVIQMRKNPTWRHPITDEIVPPGPDNPLGSRWIGFWTDGQHYIGFHGTPEEELIGQAVSHGCVRMRDADIQKLYETVGVGTSVTVIP